MSSVRSQTPAWARSEVVPSLTARRAIGIVAFAVATALAAKVAVPLPGTPVPFTLQPLVVLLAGALLGGRLGAASQALYLSMGIAGLPVFAAGGGAAYLLGPTGGYLMALPLAAFAAGSAGSAGPAARGGPLRALGALLLGLVAIYAGGVGWLALLGGASAAVVQGLVPFVLADLVKVLLALLVQLRLRDRALRLFAS